MLLASFLLSQMDVEPYIEAVFQNFAAGLILAAVGVELFPLLKKYSTPEESIVGISIGFPAGLLIIYGIEYLIDQLSGKLAYLFFYFLSLFFFVCSFFFHFLSYYPWSIAISYTVL